ncbi:NifM protein [Marinobacterium lacunae]|uniref:peptidylprolyl isomerase n=1 Tax=Marinobacterium lacunae TaxID=1232683 RepID=A0A081FYT0_9GAMM|nr:nitrogen fixation protein NifM [Marinobacterium lacunae]KEA63685.1 NifM protein [Marinobacterium lacunae]MBR9885942.1 nitrogen fixation protein NifM [Oceanospirillales bacterium]
MKPDTDNPYAVYALFKLAWSHYGCAPSELTGERGKEAAARVAHQLSIESAILYSDENSGIVVPSGQVNAAIIEIKGRFANEAEFLQALEQADLNLDLLRDGLKRELQVEAVLDRACAGKVAVSVEDAELFYYLHPERFAVAEKREVRHILITVNEQYDENTEVRALARIEAIQARLEKKPERFEEQAQKHSECPTAMHGGLVGRVERGKLFAELDAVLFDMKPGEISAPVRSELGFHLLQCGEIEPPRQVPLVEILPKLRQSLEERQRAQFQRQWIAEQLNRLNTPAQVVNA